jgi:Protein of unknown function (DUF4236)
MSFRFHKRIEITPGLNMNLAKRWPSHSIGENGATINLAQRGSRAALGIPGPGMRWQFSSHAHIKTIQAQSDIKAVHAQGTVKAVQAQAEIIGITKRVETVAKRLTRNAGRGKYWRKAAIEQAGLLDKMLDVAKASENELLIAAVRKVFERWAQGNLDYRAALDSGMTISECLAMVLEGKKPAQNICANSLSDPVVTTTNKVSEMAASESSADSDQFVFKQRYAVSLIEEPTFWSAFWKTVARNLILTVIGCGLIAIVYTLAAGKATSHPHAHAVLPATPTPEIPVEVPATQTPVVTPISERLAATSTPQAGPSTPSVQTTPTPSRHEQGIQAKTVHKRRVTQN